MYKLIFFVPEEFKEPVKEALFDIGLGELGNYSHCCFETKGIGQFKPLESSQPFLGTKGQVEKLSEYRVELLVSDEMIPLATETLRRHHPYEEPAFEYIHIVMPDQMAERDHWV